MTEVLCPVKMEARRAEHVRLEFTGKGFFGVFFLPVLICGSRRKLSSILQCWHV